MGKINGFIYSNDKNTEASSLLGKMTHTAVEGQGYTGEMEGKIIGLMGNLSHNEEKTQSISFEGEIYNISSLKNTLAEKGIKFKQDSASEIILHLYQYYGTEAFKMLDGIYVFAIYDKEKGKAFLVRDFFGEKPLHYYHSDKSFVWASSLKSIVQFLEKKPAISLDGLNLYFQLTYIPAPFTIYEGVKKLEPNSFLMYDIASNICEIKEIHTEKVEKKNISFDAAKREVRRLVEESVESRISRVMPFGTFLSGGVDSSIITWCSSQFLDEKLKTFSIGFDKKSFDETEKSRLVAKLIDSEHHEFIICEKDLKEDLDKILLHFDEPFADSSALPSYIVAAKTKQYVQIALTGDAGDEVFGGYNKYLIGGINQKYISLVPKGFHQSIKKVINPFTKQRGDERGLKFKVRKALNSIDYGDTFFYNIIKLGFLEQELKDYLQQGNFRNDVLFHYQKKLPHPKTLTDFRQVDKMISLEGDMIVKVDRMSELASLQCRAPFLNRTLWNYTLSLPDEYLLKGNHKKIILKKAFEKEFPAQFLEKSKQGFGIPVGDWLKEGIKEELLSYIDDNFLEEQGIFNIPQIKRLVLNHIKSEEDNSFRVWTFYCFQKWYKNIYLA